MASTAPRPRPCRIASAVVGLVAPLLVGPLLVGTVLATPAAADGARRIIDHRVRAGETVTGLAVRYHAWTDELLRRNHLGSGTTIHVGQRLEIPVVLAALRHDRTHHGTPPHHAGRRHRQASPTPAVVRRTVAATATRHGVDPHLALAVAWQESGWQMDRRSTAGAVGAMQVLPATGAWMSSYEGRRLHLRRLGDNATAGVRLLRVLEDETTSPRRAVAAYYQGLGALREHGQFRDTRRYVDNVLAIRHRLAAGRPPA